MTEVVIQFADLLVRSSLIAGTALGVSILARNRSAGEQVWILRTGFGLLLALPLVLYAGPSMPLHLLPAGAAAAAPVAQPIWAGDIGPVAGVAVSAAVLEPSPLVLAAWAWAIGAGVVLGRFAVGVWTLGR